MTVGRPSGSISFYINYLLQVFGVEISQKILEDQLSSIPPSLGTPRDMDLTYCTVKTGLNDLLDYLAIMITIVFPLLLGPCLVGLLQVCIDPPCQGQIGGH